MVTAHTVAYFRHAVARSKSHPYAVKTAGQATAASLHRSASPKATAAQARREEVPVPRAPTNTARPMRPNVTYERASNSDVYVTTCPWASRVTNRTGGMREKAQIGRAHV